MTYKPLIVAAVSVGSAGTWVALRDDEPAAPGPPPCCPPIFRDHTPAGLYPCWIQGYIGLFVNDPSDCVDGMVKEGSTMVTYMTVNKIRGGIGDANMDGDCDLVDHAAIVDCLQGPDFDCVCTFDYDGDGQVDLLDFADFQVAFGTGNSQ